MTPKSSRLASLDVEVLSSRRRMLQCSKVAERWRVAAEEANRRTDAAYRLADEVRAEAEAKAVAVRAAAKLKMAYMRCMRSRERKLEAQAYRDMRYKMVSMKQQQRSTNLKRMKTHASFEVDRRQSSMMKMQQISQLSEQAEAQAALSRYRKSLTEKEMKKMHDEIDDLRQQVAQLETENRRARLECQAAAEDAMEAKAKASDLGLNGEEGMVRALAARHLEKLTTVDPKHIQAKLQKTFDIDLDPEHVATLQECISKSHAIYGAARAKIEQSPGYEALLAIPELRDAELCQESDELETVVHQAEEAQDLMLHVIATAWQPHPDVPGFQLPREGRAAEWIDQAVNPGVKSAARAREKCDNDYEGHAQRLKDLARMTLSYDECAGMVRAIQSEMGACGLRIVTLKNRFAYPTSMGYSDICMVASLLLEDGTKYLVEVQINHPAMLEAKQAAHAHYEVIRSTVPKCVENTAINPNDLEHFLVENAAKADVSSAAGLKGPLEKNLMHHLEGSALDFATDQLMDKVDSLADAMKLGAEMERLAEQTGKPLTLEDIAGLPNMPDREKRAVKEKATLADIANLEDKSKLVRDKSVKNLRALEPEVLAKSAHAVAARLKHERGETREAALQVMDALAPAALAKHAGPSPSSGGIVAKLKDERREVRKLAVQVLGHLEPKPFEKHEKAIVARLDDESEDVRRAALTVLGSSLSPERLETHAAALVAALADKTDVVIKEAKRLLETLPHGAHATLTQHAKSLVAKLKTSDDKDVRFAALRALHGIEHKALKALVPAFVAKLDDEHPPVRMLASRFVADLDPEPIKHIGAFIGALEDAQPNVRTNALDALRKFEPEALVSHADALMAKLEHTNKGVRQAALQALARLPPTELKSCAFTAIAELTTNETEPEVSRVAVNTLGKLEPSDLATYSHAVLAKLADADATVRKAVVTTLGLLSPDDLATHAEDALVKWDAAEAEKAVRVAGVPTLLKLQPNTLTSRTGLVVSCLEDDAPAVRVAAVQTAAKLPPEAVAACAAALPAFEASPRSLEAIVAAKLLDADKDVRKAAVETMARLAPEGLAALTSSLVAMLDDAEPSVRSAAAARLDALDPAALASHADLGALVEHGGAQGCPGVRRAAVHAVVKLPAAELMAHAAALATKLDDPIRAESDIDVQDVAVRTLRRLAKEQRSELLHALGEGGEAIVARVCGEARLVFGPVNRYLYALGA